MDQRRGGKRAAGPRLLLRVVAALALLVVPATFPVASATFTGATTNEGGIVSAAALAAPSGLAAVQTCPPGPGISFSVSSTATGWDTVTIPLPAGTVANDLLLAHVAYRSGGRTVSAPSGWTPLAHTESVSAGVTSNAAVSALYWRKAGAAEPANATFTLSVTGTVVPVAGVIAAYSGVHRTNPIDGVVAAATGYGSTATTPTVTTSAAGARLVHILTKRQETLPAPAGTSQRWSLPSATSGNAWVGATGSDEVRATAGAVASRTSTASTFTAEWVAQVVVLRPAFGAPSAALSWTPSTTSGAAGYKLERVVGGTAQPATTITPVSANATTDGSLVDGTAYTYRLRTYVGTWESPVVTIPFTPAC